MKRKTTSQTSAGIALLMVSGMVVLLSLLMIGFVGSACIHSVGSVARTNGVQAGISAASGVEYAAARLHPEQADIAPEVMTSANRGDDWRVRDTRWKGIVSPKSSPNPSYARGDRWDDVDDDGRFTLGVDPAPAGTPGDIDGNGRFDAESGRLRGGAGQRFSLRISNGQSRIYVNAGVLPLATGDHDLDGVLNRDDPEFIAIRNAGYDDGGGGYFMGVEELSNGIPDYRDPDFSGNLQIVHLLNNLGAVIGLDTRPVDYAQGPDAWYINQHSTVNQSQLGRQIIGSRPPGGYASIEDLRSVLTPEEFRVAAPFLSTQGEMIPVFERNLYMTTGTLPPPYDDFFVGGVSHFDDSDDIQWRPRIDINGAPEEVLAACLRHLAASGVWAGMGRQNGTEQQHGYNSLPSQITLKSSFVRLSEAEGDAAARAIVAARPIRTWRRLLEVLHQNRAVFQPDPFIVGGDDQHLLKEDLILAQFNANWQQPDAFCWHWNTLEVNRDNQGSDQTRSCQILKPFLQSSGRLGVGIESYRSLHTIPYDSTGSAVGFNEFLVPARPGTECLLTPGLSQFRVESEGWCRGSREGLALMTAEWEMERGRLDLFSQRDFEQPVLPWRFPGGDLEAVTTAQERLGVQSYPAFPSRTWQNGNWHPICKDGTACPSPACLGWLQLGPVQWLETELRDVDDATDEEAITGALPYNMDGATEPWNLYDEKTIIENITDPVNRSRFASSMMGGGGVNGFNLGPTGFRSWETALYDWNKTAFERDRWNPPGEPGVPRGRIEAGMIALRFPRSGGEFSNDKDKQPFVMPYGTSTFLLRRVRETINKMGISNHVEFTCLDVRYSAADDSIMIMAPSSGQVGGETRSFPSSALPSTGRSWRTVVIKFNSVLADGTPDPNDSAFSVWIDQQEMVTENDPMFLEGNAVHDPGDNIAYDHFTEGMYALFDGPMDDCAIRKDYDFAWLSVPFVADQLVRQGGYQSPRYQFDAAALPDGGVISRIGWDTFFPKAFLDPSNPGKITFRVHCFDDFSNEIFPSDPLDAQAVYTAGDYWANRLQEKKLRLPACRSFYYELGIDAGAALPPLEDSPVLDEVRIVYAEPRSKPRYAHYGY